MEPERKDFGIHIQAEDDGENDALGLIWNRLRSIVIEDLESKRKQPNSGGRSTSRVSELFPEIIVANQESIPRTIS